MAKGDLMQRFTLATLAAASLLTVFAAGNAHAGPYPFGDEPYRLNWGYDPEIASGCWKWNWQQHHWNDHCARYVQPKAYMYPRASRAALRVKG
ncbi:MAG: hypothetical protein PS018_19135 [bacterium]|nr:hypothetical protein [bacterium]